MSDFSIVTRTNAWEKLKKKRNRENNYKKNYLHVKCRLKMYYFEYNKKQQEWHFAYFKSIFFNWSCGITIILYIDIFQQFSRNCRKNVIFLTIFYNFFLIKALLDTYYTGVNFRGCWFIKFTEYVPRKPLINIAK